MKKLTTSILFLVVLTGLPSAAYAVTAIIRVLNDSGVTLESYTIAGSTNPLNISNTAALKGYGTVTGGGCETTGLSTSEPCFTIVGQARFLLDGANVGQLKLEGLLAGQKFVVKNTGNGTARIRIEYKHTNTATNPRSATICAGMSGDGWFSGTSSTVNRPFFEQTMAVTFRSSSNTPVTTNLTGIIGVTDGAGVCDDPLVSGGSPLFYQVGVTGTSKFYNPQIPKQVFHRVPTCPTCIVSAGAELSKVLTLRLPVGGINNHVGTHFGSICAVAETGGGEDVFVTDEEPPGEEPPAEILPCEPAAQVALYIAKEASFVVGNSTLHDDRKGKILGDLFGSENFNVDDVKTDPTTGLPLCVLFAGDNATGGAAVHSSFGDYNKDGIQDLRMQFENADVQPQVGDEEVRLQCQVAITVNQVTTDQIITAADDVVVRHR